MKYQEFAFNYLKQVFFCRHWNLEKPKAIVIVVHGLGEHSGRYFYVAEKFTENNYAVISYDQFGHGKTTGKRGCNPGYKYVLNCLAKVIEKANKFYPNVPVYLYGHSMGGNVVLNYILRTKNHKITKVIASSSLLQLAFQPPRWKLSLGKVLLKIAPNVTMFNELDSKYLSRDENEIKKYNGDRLVHDRVSPNYSLSFLDAGKWAIKNAGKIDIPVFIFHGTEDGLTDCNGSSDFANNSDKATLKLYEGGYHELHNDTCKAEVLRDVVIWLKDSH